MSRSANEDRPETVLEGQDLLVVVDGRNAHPHQVPARETLAYFSSIVSLIESISEGKAVGLEIIDKCTAAKTMVHQARHTVPECVLLASQMLRGDNPLDSVPSALIESARKNIRAILSMGLSASVGTSRDSLQTLELNEVDRRVTWNRYTRVRVDRVGGLKNPTVKLVDTDTGTMYTAQISQDKAKYLAKNLYADFDVELELSGPTLGDHDRAELLRYRLVRDADPISALQTAFLAPVGALTSDDLTPAGVLVYLGRADD